MLALALDPSADPWGSPGVVARVAGADPAAAVSVFVARTRTAAAGWDLAGARTGPGTVPVPLPPGLAWVYAAAGGEATPPALASVPDPRDSVATRCRKAVRDVILALDLPLVCGRVYEQIVPDETKVTLPCVVLSVEGASETDGDDGVNAADEVGYPVRVSFNDRNAPPPNTDHSKLPLYETVRERLWAAFASQGLTAVPESVRCRVEPYVIADPLLPQYQFFVSGLTVRCFCRLPLNAPW